MADDKNNIKKLVDDYCQIADPPSSGPPSEASRSLLPAPSGHLPEFASDKDMADRLSRRDEYADQLRWQIRDLQATVAAQSEQLSEVRNNLQKKVEQLTKATALLARARKTIPALRKRNELAEERHKQEILALQGQLENIDSSFNDAGIQNQDLARQLLNLRESRELLRRKLETRDNKTERRINALKKKCKRLAQQTAEYKEQLGVKNKAIHGLLRQLTPGSLNDENAPDLDKTNQVIDYSLYGPLRDDSDENTSLGPDAISHAADDFRKRELVGRIDGSRVRFSITKDRLTIGRTIENDIQLTPSYISRQHAIIVTEDGATRVVDSGSKNGVFVNYKRVKEQPLANGDVVAVGFAKFIYREQPQADL